MMHSHLALRGYASLVVRYDQVLTSEVTNEILSALARSHLDRLTEAGWGAAGQYIADCIISGDFPSLCLYDPDVLDLAAADQYHIRQALAFFGKRKDLDIGVDREDAALRKFRDAEESCKLTNHMFRCWEQGRFQFRPLVERVLHDAQYKISQLLPCAPTLREVRARFGPGASTQVPKRNACIASKLERAPACSTNFDLRLEEALGSINVEQSIVYNPQGEFAASVEVEIHPSRVAFVPKNAKTDRSICTEPQLNGMFQLGVGDVIADALRSVGIDIKDQSANQRAALIGSIAGRFATIDLSSASDTVATKLVEHLLPLDWVDLLCGLRSALAMVGKEPLYQQKISSMGNGFTFPLETLIFWAIARSVVDIYCPKGRVLVYGDDIIVPSAAAVPLMTVLKDLGFTPNPSKSFWEGSFRESCGKDYVHGIDVRPVYVKDALTGADIFRLRNWYYLRGDPLWKGLERILHPSIRLRGPQGYGDGHLVDSCYIARPAGHKKGWSGYTFETWSHKPKLLKREIMRRWIANIPKSKHVRLPKEPVWRQGAYPLVRRIATYTAYARESTASGSSPRNRILPSDIPAKGLRAVAKFFKENEPRPANGWDSLVVPGEGDLVRTKIYILEPPRLY